MARHSPPCITARRGIRSTPQFIHTCLHRTTPINSVPLTIISRSSVIVGDCDTSSCIPPAIKLVKDSIVSVTETVIGAVSGIIFVLQTTIPLPHTINDETATNIFDSEIIVSDTEAIISITETIISGGHQHASNQRIADGLHEIIICVPEAIVSVLQMIVPGKKAIISKRIPVSDGSHTIISGPDSIVGIHEAIMFVIGTIVSATKTDFSKEDTINSTLLTSVLAAEIIMSPGGILEEKFSLLVLKLLIDDVEVSAGAATSTLKVIFFEFLGKLQVRHRLFWSLAGGERLASVLEEQTVEFAIVDEVLPLQVSEVSATRWAPAESPIMPIRSGSTLIASPANKLHCRAHVLRGLRISLLPRLGQPVADREHHIALLRQITTPVTIGGAGARLPAAAVYRDDRRIFARRLGLIQIALQYNSVMIGVFNATLNLHVPCRRLRARRNKTRRERHDADHSRPEYRHHAILPRLFLGVHISHPRN